MDNDKFCKFCGEKIDKDSVVCPKCGRQLEKIKNKEVKEDKPENEITQLEETQQILTQKWLMWIMLVFFPPVGIFFMWKYHLEMKKNTKIILTIVFTIIFIIFFFAAINDDSTSSSETFNDNSSNNTNSVVEKKVEVIDFSSMKENEILTWCKENNLECDFNRDYSDTIAKNGFIKQSVAAKEQVKENSKITITYSLGKAPTKAQENALKKAESYLKYSAFSRKGLIEQLEFEGFTHSEAVYGVDNVGADWKEQAVKKAKSYLSYSAFSRKGLIEQLEFEGFTHEQAVYGVTQNGL